MKLASIVPVPNIERIDEHSVAMYLTHLAPHYKKHTKNCYRILDNSLIELGDAVSFTDVLNAANVLDVNEIILPDVFRNGEKTFDIVNKICTDIREGKIQKPPYNLMAVCQGSSEKEFAECFDKLLSLPEIHCIGIPKVTTTFALNGRPGLEHLWQGCEKDIHLLGVWENLRELPMYKHPEKIRSVDTCIPALLSKTTACAWAERPLKTIDLIEDRINEDIYASIMQTLKGWGWL